MTEEPKAKEPFLFFNDPRGNILMMNILLLTIGCIGLFIGHIIAAPEIAMLLLSAGIILCLGGLVIQIGYLFFFRC